jgi:serine/threonine-protein kinase
MHRAQRQGLAVPLQLYIKVLCDALAGLHHAHELTDFDGSPLNVVHRDASPHNIFVTYDGQTKLVDFGIAKAASRSAETRAGVLKGKIAYMAPEQARCAQVDRRADVFSIGVLLWELLTSQRLWKGLADVEVLERLMLADVPRPRTVVPDIPEELEAICVRALALDPADRYPTAAEFRDELERYADKNLPRLNSKDLGTLVLELFSDRRRELKSIVEQQLRGISMGGGGEVRIDIVDIPTFAAMTPSGGIPRVSSGGIPQDGTPSNVATPTSNSAALSTSFAPPGRRGAVLVLAGAAAVGGMMALLLLMRTTPETTAPPEGTVTQAQPTPATPAPAPTAEVKTMELRVAARPPGAKISLDDVVLGQGSFAGRFPADGAAHTIRIEAPGHVPQSQPATFDRDVALDVALEPEKPRVTQTGARAQPPPPTQAHAPLPGVLKPPGPGKPPKRKLDSNDPWANGK